MNNNWTIKKLYQISTPPQYGWTTKASKSGKIKLLRTTDITKGEVDWDNVPYCTQLPKNISKYSIKKGDILISRAGSVGASYLVKEDRDDVVFASYLIRFRPTIDSRYVKYFLESPKFLSFIQEKKAGIALANVNASKLKELPIPLTTIDEQKRIVNKIEELFSIMNNCLLELNGLLSKVSKYQESLLKKAISGKLTSKEKFSEVAYLLDDISDDDKEFIKKNMLPANWRWAKLSSLGEISRGKSKHRPRNDPSLFNGKYPFIQTGDVRKSKKCIKEYTQTYNEKGLSQSRLWNIGTLCITIAANIAETGILTFKSCFPDSVVGFIADESLCIVEYIEFFIRTTQTRLETYAPATAQKNINLKTLNNLLVPLPPIEEQQQIINLIEEHMSICDSVQKNTEENIEKATIFKQALLAQAFEGKLI